MAKNITLMGANYSDVPAVELPQTGGGTATFTDCSVVTAVASDVAQGKYFLDAQGQFTAGTASGGGGGLTSVVRGTFKYTTEGWNTISLNYSGSGYPIAVSIYPKDGSGKDPFNSTIRRYAIAEYYVTKLINDTSPIYDGSSTTANVTWKYKSSTSTASTLATAGSNGPGYIYSTAESTSSAAQYAFKISGDKEIKVRMVDTTHNTSRYGFLVDIDYEYIIVYSS